MIYFKLVLRNNKKECDDYMNEYDLIVVGMGPSSIFLAYELIVKNKAKNVVLIDEGKPVQKRYCPVEKKRRMCKV